MIQGLINIWHFPTLPMERRVAAELSLRWAWLALDSLLVTYHTQVKTLWDLMRRRLYVLSSRTLCYDVNTSHAAPSEWVRVWVCDCACMLVCVRACVCVEVFVGVRVHVCVCAWDEGMGSELIGVLCLWMRGFMVHYSWWCLSEWILIVYLTREK